MACSLTVARYYLNNVDLSSMGFCGTRNFRPNSKEMLNISICKMSFKATHANSLSHLSRITRISSFKNSYQRAIGLPNNKIYCEGVPISYEKWLAEDYTFVWSGFCTNSAYRTWKWPKDGGLLFIIVSTQATVSIWTKLTSRTGNILWFAYSWIFTGPSPTVWRTGKFRSATAIQKYSITTNLVNTNWNMAHISIFLTLTHDISRLLHM